MSIEHKIEFNWKVLRAGDILQECNYGSKFSALLCKALGSPFSHDAIVVFDGYRLWIGESKGLHSRLTDPKEWEKQASEGKIRVRCLRKVGASVRDGYKDSAWWIANVLPRPYDWFAYPAFAFKAGWKVVLKWLGKNMDDLPDWAHEDGVTWAFWCTEGVAEAGKNGSGIDPWQKQNPTPRTTVNRVNEGKIEQIPGLLIDGQEACDTAHAERLKS